MDKVKQEFRKIQGMICSIFKSRINTMKRQNNISAILIVRMPVYDLAGTVERKKIVRSEKRRIIATGCRATTNRIEAKTKAC